MQNEDIPQICVLFGLKALSTKMTPRTFHARCRRMLVSVVLVLRGQLTDVGVAVMRLYLGDSNAVWEGCPSARFVGVSRAAKALYEVC